MTHRRHLKQAPGAPSIRVEPSVFVAESPRRNSSIVHIEWLQRQLCVDSVSLDHSDPELDLPNWIEENAARETIACSVRSCLPQVARPELSCPKPTLCPADLCGAEAPAHEAVPQMPPLPRCLPATATQHRCRWLPTPSQPELLPRTASAAAARPPRSWQQRLQRSLRRAAGPGSRPASWWPARPAAARGRPPHREGQRWGPGG